MVMREQIENDMKAAMRSGDTLTRDTLRLVIAALKNARIEVGAELTEAQELDTLQKAVKSRKDSVEQYTKAGREDLASREQAENDVISGYLPAMLGEEETRAVVQKAIEETGASEKCDIGKVMKAVMAAHKGVVDGKTVQRLAAEQLG